MTHNVKQTRRTHLRWLLTVYLPVIAAMLATATTALWLIWLLLQP